MTTTFTKASYEITRINNTKETVQGYTFTHDGIELGVCKDGGFWVVTDIISGGALGNYKKETRKAAVEHAESIINKIGKEEYVRVRTEAMESVKVGKAKSVNDEPTLEEREAEFDADIEEIEEEIKKEFEAEQEAKAQPKLEEPVKEEEVEEEKEEVIQEEAPKKKWSIGQFFKNIANLEELKKAYKKFAKWLHPDVSDYENADEAFKALQKQYEEAEKLVKQGKKVEAKEVNVEISEFLKNAINNISHIEGLEIKVKGTWVWVAGVERTAYDVHKVLKENGFRFGAKAAEWYLADETNGTKKRRGRGYSADQISEKFGEIKVKEAQRKERQKLKGAM
jgi:hypothetical protein